MTRTKSTYLALVTVLLSPMAANAVAIYDESIDGDLGEGLAEASLGTLSSGSYEVFGAMRNFESDYFSFSVAAGDRFESLILLLWDSSAPASAFRVRIAESLSLPTFSEEYSLGNSANIGQDLIALAGIGPFGSGGFSAGTRTGTGVVSYGFQINITSVSVPEPGTLALLGIGLLGMGMARRMKA